MKSYEGRFNRSKRIFDPPELEKLSEGHPVTVDGVAIRYCWHADTKEGVAESFIKSDGKPGTELIDCGKARQYPEFDGGERTLFVSVADCKCFMSVTHRGKVEIWGDELPQRSA